MVSTQEEIARFLYCVWTNITFFSGFKIVANQSDKPTVKVIAKGSKGKPSEIVAKKVALEEAYSDQSVKDYSFANFARVTANQSGMLLSFGKVHPKEMKIIIFDEILLPFDVAVSLSKIVQDQFEQLKKQGIIELGQIKPSDERAK
jgi:hypothetical protein